MTYSIKNSEKKPVVKLFILSRDRLKFCREAVSSAVTQTYENCQIIVSDNSERNDVAEMIKKEFPTVQIIRRNPPLPALDHFNKLISEADAPLIVLFHDDDVLKPQYVSCMVEAMVLNPEISAVGCNAHLLKQSKFTARSFMGDFKGPLFLHESKELAVQYLSLSSNNPAPFPGYMYRTSYAKELGLHFDKGGKHADVSFLMSVLNRAPILWIDDCLFYYRFHGSNDSKKESVADRLNLLRYLYSNLRVHPKSTLVLNYKFMYWLQWLKQTTTSTPGFNVLNIFLMRRHLVVFKFVIARGLYISLTQANFWRRIWRATCNKYL